jgi:anaerobic selenocysteine-containing dehydrogenase
MKDISTHVDEGRWIPTSCNGCFNVCAIQVLVKDGKVVDIKGDPRVASSKGKICGKAKARITDLYDPRRVTKPLKRTNPEKGIGVDPKWVEITWEEAMDTIVSKLKKIRAEDPRKLVISTFDLCNHFIAQIFGKTYGTPNDSFYPTTCGSGLHTVFGITMGVINIEVDLDHCNYIMLWGSQLGHGGNNNCMEAIQGMADAKRRGAKVVVADPIMAAAASKADEWIPLLPGTDAALALGMVNVLINDLGIYDREFLKKKTNAPYLIDQSGHYVRDQETQQPFAWDAVNKQAKVYDAEDIGDYALEGTYTVEGITCRPAFALLKEHLKKNYPLDRVEKITTVPAKTIARIAKEFGEAARIGSTIDINGHILPFRPAALEFKRGVTQHKNAFFACYSLQLLNIIVGNLDVPGGVLGTNANGPLGVWGTFKGKDGLLSSDMYYKFMTGHDSFAGLMTAYPPNEIEPPTTLNLRGLMPLSGCLVGAPAFTINDPEKFRIPYKPEMMISCRNNMVVSNSDPQAQAEMLKKVDFLLAFTININETQEFADIILPEAHDHEKHWFFPANQAAGFQRPGTGDWYFQKVQPVVPPPEGVRNWVDVMIEIADRLGLLAELNANVNQMLNLGFVDDLALKPDVRYTIEEISQRMVKLFAMMGGKELAPDVFTEKNPVLRMGEKTIQESYPGPFKEGRVPIYLEHFLDIGKAVQKTTRELGMEWWDVSHYNPLAEWRPCPAFEEDGKTYDMFISCSKLPLHTHTLNADNPWIDDICTRNRFDYNILVNTETAAKKGISDGDEIWVESRVGKVKGKVRVTGCVHPQVVGMLGGLFGQWAKAKTIARGKGVHVNTLIPFGWEYMGTITSQLDTCARVKIYKEAAI